MESYFNPALFTSNEAQFFKEYKFASGTVEYSVKVKTVDDENQLISDFVSRVVWPSALFFPAFVFSEKSFQFIENSFLEIGSGSGLLSLFLERFGFQKIVATDCCNFSIEAIRSSKDANECKNLFVEKLSWGDTGELESLKKKHGKFNFIVGTDVVYEPESLPSLLMTIYELMESNGKCYLLNHKHRFDIIENKFEQALENIPLTARELVIEDLELKATVDGEYLEIDATGLRMFELCIEEEVFSLNETKIVSIKN